MYKWCDVEIIRKKSSDWGHNKKYIYIFRVLSVFYTSYTLVLKIFFNGKIAV